MSTRGISLEKISGDYPIILVDTCVLIGEIDREGDDIERNSANFFIDYINNGNSIYVTPFVFREYSNGSPLVHRNDLLDAIQLNRRILQLDSGEKLWYDVLSEGYSKIMGKFEIEETDYDFLVSGVVLSEARKKPVALISNDMGILRAWKFLLMRECLSPGELGFFMRKGRETFKRVRPPKDYKEI